MNTVLPTRLPMRERSGMQSMQRWLAVAASIAAVTVTLLPSRAFAQAANAPAIDSAVAAAISRARGLAEAGDGTTAGALLDSLVTSQATGSNEFAEALYWRAVLSDRPADSERAWKRLVIEAPLSAHAPDALLWLGDLETVRGHPADARTYLERLLRDYPDGPQRARAMLWIARGYFDERDMTRACETVTSLLAAGVPEGELKLQADDMRRRCNAAMRAASDAAAAAAADSLRDTTQNARPGAARDTSRGAGSAATARDSSPKPAASRRQFSVQFAAYGTRAEATRMVKRLATRGITARIDGDRKPFRVRTGRYPSEADAKAALATFKKKGLTGIVAEVTR
jgi:cell division septation protein DedD